MDIAGVNVAFETGLSVTDLVAAKFRPKPIAPARPAAAITPISVRILKVSSTVLKWIYSTFVKKVALLTLCNFWGMSTQQKRRAHGAMGAINVIYRFDQNNDVAR